MSGVTVSENRTVTYYTYATVEIKCKMNFEYFPFDTQNCKFMVSRYVLSSLCHVGLISPDILTVCPLLSFSTSYDSDHLRLTASHERIKTERLQAYDAALIALPSDPEERIHGFPGNFSRAGFILTIKRISNTYKYKFIFPAAAMVCLSFISFLIDPMKQIPGRMALLITMFLVMQSLNQTIDVSSIAIIVDQC